MKLRVLFLIFASSYSVLSYILQSITVPRHGTNDDFFFNDLLAGFFTGEPEAFTNLNSASPRILFSLPVWFLFKVTNEINWYVYVLLAIVVAALSVINAVVLLITTSQNRILFCGLSNLISALFLLWWISAPTYTAAAFMPAIAAGSILLWGSTKSGNMPLSHVITAGIFLAVAISVRTESAFIPLLILVFPALLKILASEIANKFSSIVLFAALALSAHLINVFTQSIVLNSSDEWINYKEFESVRYQIHENKYQRLLGDFPNQFAWDEKKTDLFLTYNYAEEQIYNSDEMLILESRLATFDDNSEIRWVDIERRIEARVGQFQDLWILAVIISLLAIFVFPTKIVFTLLLYTNLSFILASLYILVNLRTPERIVVPALVSLLLSVILISSLGGKNRPLIFRELYLKNVIPIALFTIFLFPTFSFQLQRSSTNMYSDFAYTQEAELLSLSENAIFIGSASQFRWDWTNPFRLEQPKYTAAPTGWYTFSPPWNEKIRKMDLSELSLYREVAGQAEVFFLSNESTADNLSDLYRDELNIEVEFTLVFEKSFDFGSYNAYVIRGGSSVG